MPALLPYCEDLYRAVSAAGLRLYHYEKVASLEAGDGGDDDALVLLLRKLTSRTVVIWPEAVDDMTAMRERCAMRRLLSRRVACAGLGLNWKTMPNRRRHFDVASHVMAA